MKIISRYVAPATVAKIAAGVVFVGLRVRGIKVHSILFGILSGKK